MSDVRGSRTEGHVVLPDVWRLTVDAAESEKDLMIAVRDYLATWQPAEIAELPESCRPGRIKSGEDVSDMAYKLSQARLAFQGGQGQRLAFERLMTFFLHASARFSRIASRVVDDPFTRTDG